METITDHDIREQVVLPALQEYAAEHDVDAIVAELLETYPRAEWEYSEADLSYTHPECGYDDFWAIVERHAL